MVDVVGLELMEYRHCHGTVCKRRQESDGPVGAVASAQCDLVVLFNTGALEQQMQFGDFARHITILETDTMQVAERLHFPVPPYRVLYQGNNGFLG